MASIPEAIRRGKFGRARRALRRQLKRTPQDGAAWFWLGAVTTSVDERTLAWHNAQERGYPAATRAAEFQVAGLPLPLDPARQWGSFGAATLLTALLTMLLYLAFSDTQHPPPLAVQPAPPRERRSVNVDAQYIAQQRTQVLAAIVVSNPSDEVVGTIPYTLTIETSAAPVTRTGTLEVLLPGQQGAFVAGGKLPGGVEARSVSVEISAGEVLADFPTLTMPDPATIQISVEDTLYRVHTDVPAAPIRKPLVTVLEFDSANRFINGGTGMLFMPLSDGQPPIPRGLSPMAQADHHLVAYIMPSLYTDPPQAALYDKSAAHPAWKGQRMPYMSRGHVPASQRVQYASVPPTSGTHWPTTTGYGYHTEEIPDEVLLHNLEHGAVVIHYDAVSLSSYERAQIEWLTFATSDVSDRMIAVPHADLETPIVVTAWNYRLDLDGANLDAMRTFFYVHYGRGPECNASRQCP